MDKAYNWHHIALTINQYILTIELSETNHHQPKATNSISYEIVECSSYAMLCLLFSFLFFYNDANPVHNQRITQSIMLQSKDKNIL